MKEIRMYFRDYRKICAKRAVPVPLYPFCIRDNFIKYMTYYNKNEIAGGAILHLLSKINFVLGREGEKYVLVGKPRKFYVIERPIFLDEESGSDMLSFVVASTQEETLFAHLYDKVSSSIFFPSTLSKIGVWNSLSAVSVFEKFGFEPVNRELCYEGEAKDFEVNENEGVSFRNIDLEDPKDTAIYKRLWAISRYYIPLPYTTDHFKPKWMIPSSLLFSSDYIIFLLVKGEEIGFVQWWPNLHRIFTSGKQYFTPEEGIEATKGINEGKIFKVVVKKEYEGCGYEEMLCKRAVRRMKELGFKRYQFGNISETDKVLKDVAKNLNCRMVNSLLFMRHKG